LNGTSSSGIGAPIASGWPKTRGFRTTKFSCSVSDEN
jgi:hypothetical protein